MGPMLADDVDGEVITDLARVTPAWLTAALRRAGALDRGAVAAVDAARAPHLAVRYTPDAPPDAPARLFLKLQTRRNIAGGNGRPEVRAYRAWAGRHATLPMLPRCYDAAYDAGAAVSHVLLADFSATHALPAWPVPRPEDRLAVADCTARFHARFWGDPGNSAFGALDPNLEVDCGDGAAFLACARRYQGALAAFADFCGDRLAPADRALYGRLLAALPGLWARHLAPRLASGAHLTLVQGDSHWGQFACPADPARDATLLFDLECVHLGLPAADWAYRLPFAWTPEQRHAMEPPLVARYLAGLERCGVRGYDGDRFLADYRLSLLLVALYPLKRFTARLRARTLAEWPGGDAPGWYWDDLALLTANLRDLGCAALL